MQKVLLNFCIILISAYLPVRGQKTSMPISLAEALDIAARQQPDFKNAARNIAYAKLATQGAKASYLPSIVAESDIRFNAIIPTSVIPANAFNPSGNPKELVPIRFGTPWNNSVGLRVVQPLFDPVKLASLNGVLLGEKQAEISEKRLWIDRFEEIAGVWYGLLLAKARTKYIEKEIERNLANETLIANLLKEGRALDLDLKEAKVRTNGSELDLQKSLRDIKSSQAHISYLLGYDSLVLIEPKEDLANIGLGFSDTVSVSRITQSGKTGLRLDLEEERLLLQVGEVELARKRAEQKPVVNLEGYLGGNNFSFGFRPFENWYGNSFLGLSMRWQIFDGGLKKSQIEQAKIKLEQQRNSVQRIEQKIYYEIVQSENLLKDQKGLWELQMERIRLEKERMDIVRRRLLEGRATSKDLLDAEASVSREEDALFVIQYDYLLAMLALEKATGLLQPGKK